MMAYLRSGVGTIASPVFATVKVPACRLDVWFGRVVWAICQVGSTCGMVFIFIFLGILWMCFLVRAVFEALEARLGKFWAAWEEVLPPAGCSRVITYAGARVRVLSSSVSSS
jgi:hypothetical protein